jgi:hypothetical protein
MAGCNPLNFSGITPARFTALTAKAQQAGVPISGDSGTASQMGVTVTWNFDPAAQTLTIQCTDKPFFISCDTINGKIQDAVNQSA